MTHDRQNDTYNIDVYTDYACPYAWANQVWLDQVQDVLGDRLQITWRAFPLQQVNAPDADFKVWELPNDGSSSTLRSFQAAHAAKKQGDDAFRRFHAQLFLRRHEDGRNLAVQRVLEQSAEEAGLDLDQFREDLNSDEVFEIIRDDYTNGRQKLGVFGTPTIVFENGQGAYLKLNFRDLPEDPVEFWYDFVDTVRDRPTVIEIKRPDGPQRM